MIPHIRHYNHLVNHWKSWIRSVPHLDYLLLLQDIYLPLLDHLTHRRMCQRHFLPKPKMPFLNFINFSLELLFSFRSFGQSIFMCPGFLHSKHIIGSFFNSFSFPKFLFSSLSRNLLFLNILFNHLINKAISSSLFSLLDMSSFVCDEDVLKAIYLFFLLSSNSSCSSL